MRLAVFATLIIGRTLGASLLAATALCSAVAAVAVAALGGLLAGLLDIDFLGVDAVALATTLASLLAATALGSALALVAAVFLAFLFGAGGGVDCREVDFAQNHGSLHARRGACGEHLGLGGLFFLGGGLDLGFGLGSRSRLGLVLCLGLRLGGGSGGLLCGLGGFCFRLGLGLGLRFRRRLRLRLGLGSGCYRLLHGLGGLGLGLGSHGVALAVELDFAQDAGLLGQVGGGACHLGLCGRSLCTGGGALLPALVYLLFGTSFELAVGLEVTCKFLHHRFVNASVGAFDDFDVVFAQKLVDVGKSHIEFRSDTA